MLERAQDDGGGVLVVVDGVFLDGGRHSRRYAEICDRWRSRYWRAPDGRRGSRGRRAPGARAGTAELLGVEDRVDLRMGTFSKSLASCGGFRRGAGDVIEYLRLFSRPFLFTASAVPARSGPARGAAT